MQQRTFLLLDSLSSNRTTTIMWCSQNISLAWVVISKFHWTMITCLTPSILLVPLTLQVLEEIPYCTRKLSQVMPSLRGAFTSKGCTRHRIVTWLTNLVSSLAPQTTTTLPRTIQLSWHMQQVTLRLKSSARTLSRDRIRIVKLLIRWIQANIRLRILYLWLKLTKQSMSQQVAAYLMLQSVISRCRTKTITHWEVSTMCAPKAASLILNITRLVIQRC